MPAGRCQFPTGTSLEICQLATWFNLAGKHFVERRLAGSTFQSPTGWELQQIFTSQLAHFHNPEVLKDMQGKIGIICEYYICVITSCGVPLT